MLQEGGKGSQSLAELTSLLTGKSKSDKGQSLYVPFLRILSVAGSRRLIGESSGQAKRWVENLAHK